jgi:hypothetical protein
MSRFMTKEVYVQREPIVVQILGTNFLVFKVLVLSFPVDCMTCFVAGSSKTFRIVSVQFFVNFVCFSLNTLSISSLLLGRTFSSNENSVSASCWMSALKAVDQFPV